MTVDISAFSSYIEDALVYANGSHTFEDVRAAVAAGRMQFWPGVKSVIITEILENPRYKALNLFLAGGNLAELERMTPLVLDWGRDQGCSRAMFLGRSGWERTFLTRTGWTKTPMVVLEIPLIETSAD